MTTEPDLKSLSLQVVNEYFKLPHASSHILSNAPWVELLVDPTNGTISIAVDAVEQPVVVPELETIGVKRIIVGRGPIDRVSIAASVDDWVAVTFLASVVTLLGSGKSLSVALKMAATAHQALLAATPEANELRVVIGLFGEVSVLRELCLIWGPSVALECWRGPDGGEHDIMGAGFTAEVKTTISEKRQHRIGSLRQLEPNLSLPLSLISVRITDSPQGQTIAELIERISSEMGDLAGEFRTRLEMVYVKPNSRASQRKFSLRERPILYWVGADFEPLTQSGIVASMGDASSIRDVSYVLDLEGKVGRELSAATLQAKMNEET